MPEAEIGHAEQEKAQNKGQTEGRNHEKSNQGRNESEKLVTNFVKSRVQEGQFVSIPENSKVSRIGALFSFQRELTGVHRGAMGRMLLFSGGRDYPDAEKRFRN